MNVLVRDPGTGSEFVKAACTQSATLGQLFADRFPDADPRAYAITVTRDGQTVGTASGDTARTWDPNHVLQDEDRVEIRPVSRGARRELPLLAHFEWLLRQVGFEEGRRVAAGHALWTTSGGRTLMVKREDREHVSIESVDCLADALGLTPDELSRTLFGSEIARRKALRDLRNQGKLAARPGRQGLHGAGGEPGR